MSARELSERQEEALRIIGAHRPDIEQLARLMGARQSTASMIRNILLRYGLVEPWFDFHERTRLSREGREALRSLSPMEGE